MGTPRGQSGIVIFKPSPVGTRVPVIPLPKPAALFRYRFDLYRWDRRARYKPFTFHLELPPHWRG